MAVVTERLRYKGYGECVRVSNGLAEAIALTEVGPRVISYGMGGVNVFHEVPPTAERGAPPADRQRRRARKAAEYVGAIDDDSGHDWVMYGGHRLWHSPEAMPRTYMGDNAPVKCRALKNGVRLTQDTEDWTHIKKEIKLTMAEGDASVTVVHTLTNEGAWDVDLSSWAISVMRPGGIEVIPQPALGVGLLPDRLVALWPYTSMGDARVTWGERYILVRQKPGADRKFKIGLPH
ncbi:MAG: hypothetical protein FWE70_05520, partial [Oscillospiraceae bacterium]|nr:hypothetical protein [Oscillospiraceae bacterium]